MSAGSGGLVTPGGMAGAPGRAGGAGARGGMPVGLYRKPTAEKRLVIRWDHPRGSEDRLDFETAVKEVRGQDLRPMLVLRDCEACKGEDDALIYRRMDNEKTKLLAQWFHCVKLERRVVQDKHPFHSLFAGKNPPHLFVASWDGSVIVRLSGRQPMKDLHAAMLKVLRKDYRKDPIAAVKGWLRCLDKYDTLDSRVTDLLTQLRRLQEDGDEKRVAKVKSKLEALDVERARIKKAERRLFALVLRHAPKEKTLDDFDSEAANEVKALGGGLLDRLRKKGGGDKD